MSQGEKLKSKLYLKKKRSEIIQDDIITLMDLYSLDTFIMSLSIFFIFVLNSK